METLSPAVEERVRAWLEGPFDPKIKEEIKRLMKSDPKEIEEAFFKDLSFGTGGMRGIMGIGTNRMNTYTVGAATQGLANYIKLQCTGKKQSVFIGYDVRHHSREFAEEAARVLAGNNLHVLLSKEVCPTPLVSFACRYFGCSAAIMITASHNPPEYNGYKVYWNDGGQVVAPHDVGIMLEVAKIKSPSQIAIGSKFSEVGEELDFAYLAELKKLQLHPELANTPLKIVYSNLHGTGLRLVPKALESWGYKNISLVDKQKPLDGNFTNAHSPNPEEKETMRLGTEQLIHEKGDFFLATDPDADRVGVVALDEGRAIRLTGNQTACLCLYHICSTMPLPKRAAFIKTIVTTELFRAIAESFGAKCIDVLTGFKYIGEKIQLWEKNQNDQFVFGAEESYGSLFGTFVRDKDAISASCLIAETAAEAKRANGTLATLLYQLYQKYGIHRESLTNLTFSDSQAGMKKMQSMMKHLRENPPKTIGSEEVGSVEDYINGYAGLPKSDVLRFWMKDGSKLVIRPSGTEPKVKIYAEVKQTSSSNMTKSIADCDRRLAKLVDDFQKIV